MIRTWAQRTLPPILASLLWPAFTARVEGGPFTNALAELQPVVVTGGEVPDLLGLPVDEIWAYRYDAASASFIQIAVQADERAPLDLTSGQGAPIYELTYDWFGDEDGLLDADDEVAFMARDAGERAPGTDVWVAGASDTRIEVRIEDPLTSDVGWVYLFTSPTLVDEDPGFSHVSFVSSEPASGVETVETPTYVVGYEGRWRVTRIDVKPHPDILDRIKVRAYALVGGETEEHYELTSKMLGSYAGKVRALREVQGAASGPYTTVLDSFYRDTWVRTANLRVHPISDIWYYYDYLPPSGAGRFYSSTHLPGLEVDGVSESPTDQPFPMWSQMSLPDGTLVSCVRELTSFPFPDPRAACAAEAGVTFYWQDDATFDDLTGDDAAAIGNHGLNLYCLDDTNTAPYSNELTHYFLPPQDPYTAVGAAYAARQEDPLQLTAQAQVRDASCLNDEDGDGFRPDCDLDCDDTNPDIYPGAPELCDGLDNDCDGEPAADEIDSDGDDVLDCSDDCPDDACECGCGVADTDGDADASRLLWKRLA